jgi:acetyl esterase/lipase
VTTRRTRRTTVRYGDDRAQVAELWMPPGRDDPPVLVLVHGGFWRQRYTKRLMHGLAKVAVASGWAAYNIEYRRVGPQSAGGWPETFDDVTAAVEHLVGIVDVGDRGVVTCGHSAGGHLALWLAGPCRTAVTSPPRRVPVRAVISLAGIPDLAEAQRLGLGSGAVTALMGGTPLHHPARYRLGSPAALLPLGVPQFLVHGLEDATVPAALSAAHAARARACGDEAEFLALTGVSHLDMIRTRGPASGQVAALLTRLGRG